MTNQDSEYPIRTYRCRTCMAEWFSNGPSKCRCARRGWTPDVVQISPKEEP